LIICLKLSLPTYYFSHKNKILDDHNKQLDKTGINLKDIIDRFGKFTIAFFGLTRGISKFKSLIQEYADEYSKLDDVLVQVQKYTGIERAMKR
jgi:hypothetical protein